MRVENSILKLLIFSLILILLSVESCNSQKIIEINKVVLNPEKFKGKNVYIKGRVIYVNSLLKYFEVEDKTGKITVITNNKLPKIGKEVKIKGRVYILFHNKVIIIEENGG